MERFEREGERERVFRRNQALVSTLSAIKQIDQYTQEQAPNRLIKIKLQIKNIIQLILCY